MKLAKSPVRFYSFDEFIEYGLEHSDNIVDEMPWSFEIHGYAVTHENDQCYLVPTERGGEHFTPNNMLMYDIYGKLQVTEIPGRCNCSTLSESKVINAMDENLWVDSEKDKGHWINGREDAADAICSLAVPDEGEQRACPCNYGEPCKPNCTCVNPFSSAGCERCCTYGSLEQREYAAKRIKAALPQISDERIEELWERFCFTSESSDDDFIVKLMTKPQFILALKELTKKE